MDAACGRRHACDLCTTSAGVEVETRTRGVAVCLIWYKSRSVRVFDFNHRAHV